MSKKIVACFGCSITGGVYNGQEPRESWPLQLSLSRPDLIVYNFGLQGSSVLYTINMIEQAKKQLNPDLIIAQIANPVRITFYSPDFKLNVKRDLLKISENYHVIPANTDGIFPINGIIGKKEKREIQQDAEKLARYNLVENLYMLLEDENHFDVEYRALALRVESLSNFCFVHKEPVRVIEEIQHISCVGKTLGIKFRELVIDKAFHFGEPGSQWIANWVADKLKL